ncbi:hypothetical protein [Candidatus Erwinia dacicola]|jgi:hypothetical protein|uniref:Uncharacterized protein n=1 Tax=Candidatus Erwinia dacicola TaxID=252393 RepID=A0A1E7Z4F3_9GAMM|nr:hypothetical protein [Candidatus Erwinia dacicola]OFC63614.1 hypothetical protein BBW68_00720 [Candidatus Erwinia dacicola]RAP73078.1 hypothetical protein ACZ87_00091 [Candidatus Erwinia dacicola]
MNYAGIESLRSDVAELVNMMDELWVRMNALGSHNYRDDTPAAELMARQAVTRINALFLNAYREMLALNACFKD